MLLSSIITAYGQNKTRKPVNKTSTTSKPRSNAAKSNTKVYKVGNVSFSMVYVEGGDCVLGRTSDQGTPRHGFDDDPVDCYLSSFYISQTVVTEELWTAVMGEPYSDEGKGPKYPVQPNWDECQVFMAKLNAKTGGNFRLPTEWEWEYAARGGKKSNFYKYAGGNDLDEVGWDDNDKHPVGTKKPNELGIYEMSGSPYEWCKNFYYEWNEGGKNPQGSYPSGKRSIRGMGTICQRWSYNPVYAHMAFRILRPLK